jgi:hypothetical protein
VSTPFGESRVVEQVARDAARRVTRRVIAELQRLSCTLSGDDSGLETVWDELCVQMQFQESFAWNVYEETVQAIDVAAVSELATHERDAIWLQTDAGHEWEFRDPQDRMLEPVCEADIVAHITREHVYAEAGRWSNKRIRAYLERW